MSANPGQLIHKSKREKLVGLSSESINNELDRLESKISQLRN